eukprot:TRINITY_DN63225_c0_g1_i1.p1 TRINITY_DN63225_c0_g1~~TRINITY_DN63225_c0_g1_i1.p1  ORF type:complete len:622 (-),score=79.62 TRINITY_DN63225_c0_g1_i1:36-1901(-)
MRRSSPFFYILLTVALASKKLYSSASFDVPKPEIDAVAESLKVMLAASASTSPQPTSSFKTGALGDIEKALVVQSLASASPRSGSSSGPAGSSTAFAPVDVPNASNSELNIFISQFRALLRSMLANIAQSMQNSQQSCVDAYSNLTSCPNYTKAQVFLPTGFDGNFVSLRQDHRTCRGDEGLAKLRYENCKTQRRDLVLQEQAALQLLNSVNVFNSPEECAISGDAETYYDNMENHFQAKANEFFLAYYRLKNITANFSLHNCDALETTYHSQRVTCEEKQNRLEELACETHSRTNSSCTNIYSCPTSTWNHYKDVVAAATAQLTTLKAEYRAVRRLECLLGVFSAANGTDINALIDDCINKVWDTSVISSQCADDFSESQNPALTYVVPDVCTNGVQAIGHPNSANFVYTEYTFTNTAHGPCSATCCTRLFFTYKTYPDKSIPSSRFYTADVNSGRYTTLAAALEACELLSTVSCWGVYYTVSDGGQLIAAGASSSELTGSSIGSTVIQMVAGDSSSATPSVRLFNCTYEVNITKSGMSNSVWKTLEVGGLSEDDIPRFDGCTTETEHATACISNGISSGARVMKNRAGQGVYVSETCCGSEANAVSGHRRLSCSRQQIR